MVDSIVSEKSETEGRGWNDLSESLDNIYNTYTKQGNESIDTLDSNVGRGTYLGGGTSRGHSGRMPVHLSSRLSSIGFGDENVVKSAPQTPNSASSFDFTMNDPNHPQALTNSSLNVLLGTPSAESYGKSFAENSPEIKLVAPSEVNATEMPPAPSIEANENEEKWEEKGAAYKAVSDGSSYRIIKRTVHDFKFGKQLGEGSYSTVLLATDNNTGIQYAVKVLDKRHIIKEKKVKYVNIEKHALNRLSNRMGIISLYFTFQDKNSLYFVLDYASNGELLALIKKYGTLNEDCTRHFGGQILDAISYMHDNGVIHRDIKPENILLDEKLRIQITDFGTARMLEKKNDESEEYPVDVRAKSFVGTAEYVSPELLENKYCGKPGDVWAFGCIIYQMIAGKPPFKAPNEYLTFQKITKLQYAFSAGFPMIVRDLIKQILVLQPSKRATVSAIKSHYFFQSIDFSDFDSVWMRDPPELGPYKVNAKSMLMAPELTKSSSQPQIITRPSSKKVNTVTNETNGRSVSEGNGKPLDPASVAAFVLNNKKEDNSQDSEMLEPDTSLQKVSSKSSRTGSTKAPAPDYIPGTNILRPTINTRSSYSRSQSTQKRRPSKPKSKVLDVSAISSVELAWSEYLNHPDERILSIGPVIAHKEDTDSFLRKNKGFMHDSPLKLGKYRNASSNPRGTSLLTQVVHGSSNGLRVADFEQEEVEEYVDESVAITDFFEIEEVPPTTATTEGSSESGSKKSLFRKLLMPHLDKQSKDPNQSDSDSAVTINEIRQHPLEKSRTCTMLITTHGRALIFMRNDQESNYRLISEIKLTYPFLQFKEIVGASGKLQKLLPSTGSFAIVSLQSTFVFEVEKHEVNQWTENILKSKLNQLEREKIEAETIQHHRIPSSASNSPRLLDSPNLNSSGHARGSSVDYGRSDSDIYDSPGSATTPQTPKTPQFRSNSSADVVYGAKSGRKSAGRKPPPGPHVPPKSTERHYPQDSPASNESVLLQAAQIAVSHVPPTSKSYTQNRRSSFTSEARNTSSQHPSNGSKNGTKKMVTSMNSKLLARSQRKK